MNRSSVPSGQSSSGVLKAMLWAYEREKGAAAADAWLRAIRMVRDDLSDETRMVPLTTLVGALRAFAEAHSRDAIPELWSDLIALDNLGVWMRVLRGTTTPTEAFARLDSGESEYGRTTRWETFEARPGFWRGRVNIAHDPMLEVDGLLRLARIAELRAVPPLFGYAVVSVAELPAAKATGFVQEFAVTWTIPKRGRALALGVGAGLLVGAVPVAAHLVSTGLGLIGLVTATGIGAALGVSQTRDVARQAENRAQSMRVHALERSLVLKETRERSGAGQLEGSVVAGQYRIMQRMGSGASGVIYEATRMSDGLPVALKLLRAAAAHDAVASDRLRREAEALGLAWHPNVVEVIDHGYLPDGTAFLVMELLRGESLSQRLKTKSRLTTAELMPIAMQVCDALAAVHAAGVVHRDLKPSNIFLAVDREDLAGPMRVKLLDFGIARVEWEETRITNTGGPLGTPGYMSPEQELGLEVDGRSDIFALGAVLFESLVGEPPPPLTPSGLVRAAPSANHDGRLDSGTHRAAKKYIPSGWLAIIDKAMSTKPEDRFADARSVAHELRGVRDEAPRAEAGS